VSVDRPITDDRAWDPQVPVRKVTVTEASPTVSQSPIKGAPDPAAPRSLAPDEAAAWRLSHTSPQGSANKPPSPPGL